MCMGMDYEYWEPYWKSKYGTKPLNLATQEVLEKKLGKRLSQVSKEAIYKTLKELGLEQLIIEE